jgi:hypothetical protein
MTQSSLHNSSLARLGPVYRALCNNNNIIRTRIILYTYALNYYAQSHACLLAHLGSQLLLSFPPRPQLSAVFAVIVDAPRAYTLKRVVITDSRIMSIIIIIIIMFMCTIRRAYYMRTYIRHVLYVITRTG